MNEPVLSVEVDTLVMVREAEGGGAACVSRSFLSFPTASVLNIRKLLCRDSAEPQFHISEETKGSTIIPCLAVCELPDPLPQFSLLSSSPREMRLTHTTTHSC